MKMRESIQCAAMKLLTLTIIVFATSLVSISAPQNEWPKYVAPKQQKEILKKAARSTGVGGLLIKSSIAGIYWVTESAARALVSQMIDKERLTNEESDARYAELRKDGVYTIAVYSSSLGFGGIGRPKTVNETVDPIGKNDFFLQRADDRKVFSKAAVEKESFDLVVNTPQTIVTYTARLSKQDRQGQPIVRSLDDKFEVQFSLSGKKAILDYKIKDLVMRLEDL